MNKLIKLSFLIIILLLVVGGVFYWRNQQAVVDLNKGLPAGIKVVKSLTGNYILVNKIDGYSFKVPDAMKGLSEIYYIPEISEQNYNLTTLELEGKEGAGRIVGINRFIIEEADINLETWAEQMFSLFGLEGDFIEDKIGELEILKTREGLGVIGYIYFFQKNSVLYTITCTSAEFIQDIIANGKW